MLCSAGGMRGSRKRAARRTRTAARVKRARGAQSLFHQLRRYSLLLPLSPYPSTRTHDAERRCAQVLLSMWERAVSSDEADNRGRAVARDPSPNQQQQSLSRQQASPRADPSEPKPQQTVHDYPTLPLMKHAPKSKRDLPQPLCPTLPAISSPPPFPPSGLTAGRA